MPHGPIGLAPLRAPAAAVLNSGMNNTTALMIIVLGTVLRVLPALLVLYLILRPRPAVVTGYVREHEDDPAHHPHYPHFAGA